MRSMKYTAALAAAAALLLLAACGGGGGSPSGSGPSGPPAGQRAVAHAGTADAASAQTAVGDAGQADPQFGSVFQTSNNSSATATFDGSRFGLSVSGGSTFSLNSADHSLGSTDLDSPVMGHIARSWGLARTSANSLSGAAVFVSWDSSDRADWLAGGYWLHAIGDLDAGTITSVAAGAFVYGPEFVDRTTNMPTDDTATYSGIAGGIYAYGNPSEDVEVGEALGTVRLSADFGAGTIAGSINLETSNDSDVELTLGSANFASNGRIPPTNITGLTIDGTSQTVDGKWGGRFSNVDDNGLPRRVAGTVGGDWTESDGTEGSFVGAFLADKQ